MGAEGGLPRDVKIAIAVVSALVVPMVVTQLTVRETRDLVSLTGDPTPYGYTVSLGLWAGPVSVLLYWFLRRWKSWEPWDKWALVITAATVGLLGLVLDILFASRFFHFHNRGATLEDLWLPVVGGRIPIEEIFFYLGAGLFLVLSYFWVNHYWFGLRSPKDAPPGLVFNWWALAAVAALALAGLAYKKYGDHPYRDGLPEYYLFQLGVAVAPGLVLFRWSKNRINWRAFTLATCSGLLISLIWEASLGFPYQWWGYNLDRMLGLLVPGWFGLPIEAPMLWLCTGLLGFTVIEVLRVYLFRYFTAHPEWTVPSEKILPPDRDPGSVGRMTLLLATLAVPFVATQYTIDRVLTPLSVDGNPSPLGLTASLSMWYVPVVMIAGWLIPRWRSMERYERRSLLYTSALLVAGVLVLELTLATRVWAFPYRGAHLSWELPAIGGRIPVGAILFHIGAALASLLSYHWLRVEWFAPSDPGDVTGPLIRPDWRILGGGVAILVAVLTYHNLQTTSVSTFPGYFLAMVSLALVPVSLLAKATRAIVSWPALTAIAYSGLLVSVMWEALLAVPYQWWVYRPQQIIGPRIPGWTDAPAEAPLLWISTGLIVFVAYETLRLVIYRIDHGDPGAGRARQGGFGMTLAASTPSPVRSAPSGTVSTASEAPQLEVRDWRRILAPYETVVPVRSLWQLVNTLAPFGLLWWAMLATAEISTALTLVLAVPTAGFVCRMVCIQHDCGHGAFLRSRRAGHWLGRALSLVTLLPYDYWWRTKHALHHSSSGDLSRRGQGDVRTLTVAEYRRLDRFSRLRYRIYRNPLVLLIVAPSYLFLVRQRFVRERTPWRHRAWRSVLGTNLGALALFAALGAAFGYQRVLLIQLPIWVITATAGVFLFYVQHQFEDTYWADGDDWDYCDAALRGSSFLDLPRVLHWFTGNISYHHIHHLSSAIPFYRLPECFAENPVLQRSRRLTPGQAWHSLSLALWDERTRRLVSFRSLPSER